MKRGTIFLSVVLALMVGGHQPAAWACSCVGGLSQADYFDVADHVFIGVVVGAADPGADQNGLMNSGREITWTFDVDAVEKGGVTDPVDVGSAADGASCGYAFSEGVRYRVYVHEARDGGLETGLCSGNEEVEPTTTSGRGLDEPVSTDGRDGDGGSAAPPPGAEPAAGGVEPVGGESDDATGIGGLAIGLIATAGVAAAGGLVLTRRRRISPR